MTKLGCRFGGVVIAASVTALCGGGAAAAATVPDYISSATAHIVNGLQESGSQIGTGTAVSVSSGVFPTSYQYAAAIAGSYGPNAGFPDLPDINDFDATHAIETQNHNGFALSHSSSTGGFVESYADMQYYFQVASLDGVSSLISIYGDYTLKAVISAPIFGYKEQNESLVFAGANIMVDRFDRQSGPDGLDLQLIDNCSGGQCLQYGTITTVGSALFSIYTDTLYRVTLHSAVTARGGGSGVALADPYFYVDPTLESASRYQFEFSPTVGNNPLTSPTPEPIGWALMIMGFGAVGAAMRRQGPFIA